ncbi:DUF4232 domain-containing protein [Streptomyces scopuliridis]|uniref:DUF4232 domain-containing protein n=1 Tax=Streptomyces scopuliridis RB72 TaxID=1440053 RepID=A0A2T7SY54_9ACTN|nr:DUF4232 domain-containing protein [Streptomyces scopuliridis]PVE07849.1 hypothetical protein Y717_21265 [Streptomyces scopuliridis RB72]
MRTIRHRAAAAAVTALVASLALTACGSGESSAAKDSGGAAASLSTAPSAEQRSTGDDKQQTPADQISSSVSSKSKTGTDTGNTAGNKSSDGATTKYTDCTGDNTKVKISQVSRPINHLLLTVTNTGNKNCDAYYAPALRFDDAQAVTQIIEESKPQAVVTLAPGESAYASIALAGEEAPDIPVKQLTVHFMGRDNQGSVGSPSAPLTLPAGTLISASTSVTYWLRDMADALTW